MSPRVPGQRLSLSGGRKWSPGGRKWSILPSSGMSMSHILISSYPVISYHMIGKPCAIQTRGRLVDTITIPSRARSCAKSSTPGGQDIFPAPYILWKCGGPELADRELAPHVFLAPLRSFPAPLSPSYDTGTRSAPVRTVKHCFKQTGEGRREKEEGRRG